MTYRMQAANKHHQHSHHHRPQLQPLDIIPLSSLRRWDAIQLSSIVAHPADVSSDDNGTRRVEELTERSDREEEKKHQHDIAEQKNGNEKHSVGQYRHEQQTADDASAATSPSATGAISPLPTAASSSSLSSVPISSPTPTPSPRPVRFPIHPFLNHKLVVMQGDILTLPVDALVHTTNERLNEFQLYGVGSLGWRVMAYCGPSFQQQCQQLVASEGGVATGDATIMPSHALHAKYGGARYVIHTVSPKYSEKFQVAAQNALHGCIRRSLENLLDTPADDSGSSVGVSSGGGSNTLHSIAFPLIHTARKGYPVEDAAHIVLRTLRKFLEKYGRESVHTVVICLQKGIPVGIRQAMQASSSNTHAAASTSLPPAVPLNEDEVFSIYSRLLPLYFPRTPEEELLQTIPGNLPADLGNELGETEVRERKIRIVPFIQPGPRPFTSEERERMRMEQQNRDRRRQAEVDHVATSNSSAQTMSPTPSSTFFPQRTEYPSPSEYPSEPRSAAPADSSTTAPPSRRAAPIKVTHNPASFAAVHDDPDLSRLRSFHASLTPDERAAEMEVERRYYHALKLAQSCNHSDMGALDACQYIVESSHVDIFGRRIVQVFGVRVPLFYDDGRTRVSKQHLAWHALKTMDSILNHPCVIIYHHADVNSCNRPDTSFFHDLYTTLPRALKHNVRILYIVHPTWYLRSALWIMAASFIDNEFYQRIIYIHKLSDLYRVVDPHALDVPSYVRRYDRARHGRSDAHPDDDQL